jgi:hypothetical protein
MTMIVDSNTIVYPWAMTMESLVVVGGEESQKRTDLPWLHIFHIVYNVYFVEVVESYNEYKSVVHRIVEIRVIHQLQPFVVVESKVSERIQDLESWWRCRSRYKIHNRVQRQC